MTLYSAIFFSRNYHRDMNLCCHKNIYININTEANLSQKRNLNIKFEYCIIFHYINLYSFKKNCVTELLEFCFNLLVFLQLMKILFMNANVVYQTITTVVLV